MRSERNRRCFSGRCAVNGNSPSSHPSEFAAVGSGVSPRWSRSSRRQIWVFWDVLCLKATWCTIPLSSLSAGKAHSSGFRSHVLCFPFGTWSGAWHVCWLFQNSWRVEGRYRQRARSSTFTNSRQDHHVSWDGSSGGGDPVQESSNRVIYSKFLLMGSYESEWPMT